ncbi:BPSL0067 family protein [Magnetospirillum sp. ME-1]|uniref:BPSL0067 family protein n=1 Tax=Magnetospirillum sp. ME-1 TaxID=1639348 RepID=UPI000A18EE03|nr:BPSL0067 family protein [Magnetospirillum sp. ME-1]
MPNNYDSNQPRDDHGRWSKTASEHGYVVKDFEAKMAKVIAGNTQVGESSECVALVKHLAPEVGRAADWQEGPPIRDFGVPPLERGTPIATFKNGRYPNKSSGNHAAIFLEYGVHDGQRGIWVFDQSKNDPPQKTFKQFPGRAEHYSVIKRK